VKTVKEFAENSYSDVSVGLFTNSSMLFNEHVLIAFSPLDHVEAKIDAIDELKFNAINMPDESLTLRKILNGLKNFRKTFDGEIAMQVMLLRLGSFSNAEKSDAEALKSIEPDHVHLYTVYRKPRLSIVKPIPKEEIKRFASILTREGVQKRKHILSKILNTACNTSMLESRCEVSCSNLRENRKFLISEG